MCGIVAPFALAAKIVPVLLEGLRKLEYRGYVSAGLAVHNGSSVKRVRTAGREAELAAADDGVSDPNVSPKEMRGKAFSQAAIFEEDAIG